MKNRTGWTCPLCVPLTLLLIPLGSAAELPKYEVVDLGTLGGENSFGTAINEAGEVTGWSETAAGSPHAFRARKGRPMQDLGTLGGQASFGNDINDSGVITGESRRADGASRAFRARTGQPMVDLGTLGGDFSTGEAINNVGQITGGAEAEDGSVQPFIAGAGQPMRALQLPPDHANGRGTAINSAGGVAGTYFKGGFQRCFSAASGMPSIDLGTLGGNFCAAFHINDSGTVTGEGGTADGWWHAFLASAGQPMTDLGTLGGPTSTGNAINNRGQVTGASRNPAGNNRAFIAGLDQPMIDLGTLGGVSSAGADINDAGQVTGQADTEDPPQPSHPHAFVAEAGRPMIDLGALDGQISTGLAINNAGQVVGWWLASDGDVTITRTFLATPISLLFRRLLNDVKGVGPGKSLANKVRNALAYYDADDKQATCAALQGFSQQVKAQRGKKIKPEALANRLIADAKSIMRAIGCS